MQIGIICYFKCITRDSKCSRKYSSRIETVIYNSRQNIICNYVHDDLISSVNIGPLNFANDLIEYMVEKMHIKLANILNSEKNLKADKHLTIKVEVLGKALKHNPF